MQLNFELTLSCFGQIAFHLIGFDSIQLLIASTQILESTLQLFTDWLSNVVRYVIDVYFESCTILL